MQTLIYERLIMEVSKPGKRDLKGVIAGDK